MIALRQLLLRKPQLPYLNYEGHEHENDCDCCESHQDLRYK